MKKTKMVDNILQNYIEFLLKTKFNLYITKVIPIIEPMLYPIPIAKSSKVTTSIIYFGNRAGIKL